MKSSLQRLVAALVAVVVVGGLTACAPSLPLQVSPSRTEVSAERVVVPMLPHVHGIPRVAVRVNNAKGEMIVDTGAFSTLVSADLVARATAQVRNTTMRSVDAGGNIRTANGIVRFDAIDLGSIGTASFLNLEAVVQDVSVLDTGGDPIGGAIGMPVFRDVLLTFDYPNEQIVIAQGELPKPNGSDILPLRVGRLGRPMVPLQIGQRTVWTLLDTGFSSGLGLPNWARKQFAGADKSVSGAPFAYYHGQGQAERARLKEDLHIGWHVIRQPIVELGLGNDPVIGAEYLKHFVITIDQRNGRVRFTRKAITPIKVDPIVGPGFYIDLVSAKVIAVVPRSGAARVGLRIGDRLERIEGIPFEQYRTMDSPRALHPGSVSLVYVRDGRRTPVIVPITVLLP